MDSKNSVFWIRHKFYILLIGIGFFVYFNSLFGDFIWDDIPQISFSPLANSLSSIPTIFTIGQGNAFYRPIFLSYLTVVNVLFLGNVFFFHLFQLSMHIVNTLFVFWIFKNFFKEIIAFSLSLIFLVHPMNVEAVSYMSAVSDVLVFMFGILVLRIFMKTHLFVYHFTISGFLILLALLTKESGVLWLPIVLIYMLLFKKDKALKALLFIGISAGLYFFMRVFMGHITTALSFINNAPIAKLSFVERLLSLPKIIFFYIYTFIFPANLSISQHWIIKSTKTSDFILPLIFDIFFFSLTTAGIFYIYKYHKKALGNYIFFLIWFIVSLGLYMQILPLDMTVAERWFYVPMVGILGMIGVIAQSIKVKAAVKSFVAFITIIIIICFSLRTIVRNTNWNNSLTLYKHDAQINKYSFDLENQLASQLSSVGKYDEALIHSKRAIELEPNDTRNWVTIGAIYMRKNQVKEGIAYLRKAVDYDGGNYNAFYNLSYGYLLLNNPQEAKSFAEWGMKTYPQDANLLLFKAVAEYNLGDRENALRDAEKANSILRIQNSNYIYTQILNKKPINLTQ